VTSNNVKSLGGAAQVQLCNMYDYEVTNLDPGYGEAVYNANNGGQATWQMYWPNSSWPNGTF
jgi:hypothetical protein